MQIRLAKESDYEKLMRLYNDFVGDDRYSKHNNDSFKNVLNSPKNFIFVAEDKGSIVGFAAFSVSIGDIAVKSNLTEFTFFNSPSLIDKQRALFEKISSQKGSFLTFTQSLYQTTLIANSVFEKEVKKIFKEERLLSNLTKLSAIILTLSAETVKTPGVYNFILNKLAWFGINVIEVASSFTELNLIVEDAEVDRAFSVLKNLNS